MRERRNKSSQKVVKLFKRNWVYPTIYLLVAAVLISGAFLYQFFTKESPTSNPVPSVPTVVEKEKPTTSQPTVVKPAESVKMPVAEASNVEVVKGFYDVTTTAADQEKALVVNGTTYTENKGIDLKAKDGKPFEVRAALSGTVKDVKQDPMLGMIVTLDHGGNIVTFYQSLSKVDVAVGDKVTQGAVLGMSGQSELTKEEGNVVHFEVRKDGKAINPSSIFDRPVSAIDEVIDVMKKEAASTKEQMKKEESNEIAPSTDEVPPNVKEAK